MYFIFDKKVVLKIMIISSFLSFIIKTIYLLFSSLFFISKEVVIIIIILIIIFIIININVLIIILYFYVNFKLQILITVLDFPYYYS